MLWVNKCFYSLTIISILLLKLYPNQNYLQDFNTHPLETYNLNIGNLLFQYKMTIFSPLQPYNFVRRLNAFQFILQSSAFPFLPGLLKLSNWLQLPLHISVVKIYHSVCGRKHIEGENIKSYILCHSNLRYLTRCHTATV